MRKPKNTNGKSDKFPINLEDLIVEDNHELVAVENSTDIPLTAIAQMQADTKLETMKSQFKMLLDQKKARLEMMGTLQAQLMQFNLNIKPTLDQIKITENNLNNNFQRLVELESLITNANKLIQEETEKRTRGI